MTNELVDSSLTCQHPVPVWHHRARAVNAKSLGAEDFHLDEIWKLKSIDGSLYLARVSVPFRTEVITVHLEHFFRVMQTLNIYSRGLPSDVLHAVSTLT